MKAFLHEAGREAVLAAIDEAPVVASCRMSYVECHAAFARARREGRLTHRDERGTVQSFVARWVGLVVIEVDQEITEEAASLVRRFPLRAGDALHLASARRLAAGTPAEVRFGCWDRRLWEAAREGGFQMLPAMLSGDG